MGWAIVTGNVPTPGLRSSHPNQPSVDGTGCIHDGGQEGAGACVGSNAAYAHQRIPHTARLSRAHAAGGWLTEETWWCFRMRSTTMFDAHQMSLSDQPNVWRTHAANNLAPACSQHHATPCNSPCHPPSVTLSGRPGEVRHVSETERRRSGGVGVGCNSMTAYPHHTTPHHAFLFTACHQLALTRPHVTRTRAHTHGRTPVCSGGPCA